MDHILLIVQQLVHSPPLATVNNAAVHTRVQARSSAVNLGVESLGRVLALCRLV